MIKPDEFFDELETMSPVAREKYFHRHLTETVAHAYHHAPAVKEMFDQAGVSPGQIANVKDLERVPIIRKTDLIDRQKADPPYGGFVTIPYADIDRIFLSPGPVYEPVQTARIKWFGKAFCAAGFRKGDVVMNTFTYHMSPAGILFHEALRDCGATVVPMGTGNTDIQVQTMRDLRVTGIVSTPSFLMTLIKRAEELGHSFNSDFSLKRAWFTGEMLPPSLRTTFEETYRIDTYQTYAVTETGGALAYECSQKSGMHLMDESVIEIVDPATGKQLGPGEVGEIVATPVHNRQWGLIRFGTGDMSAYVTDPCPCGRTSHRLTGIVGRTSDAVKVRGMFVVARQVEQVMAGFGAIARYQLVVTRKEERDELALHLELKQEASSTTRQRLVEDVIQQFQNACRLKIDHVAFLNRGTLPDQPQKLLDRRVWK
ncbi:MAG: AMP-binding protein [Chloroflexi bacterium]|nr:AMP-binding protein [Chloroflexota bacterium]